MYFCKVYPANASLFQSLASTLSHRASCEPWPPDCPSSPITSPPLLTSLTRAARQIRLHKSPVHAPTTGGQATPPSLPFAFQPYVSSKAATLSYGPSEALCSPWDRTLGYFLTCQIVFKQQVLLLLLISDGPILTQGGEDD